MSVLENRVLCLLQAKKRGLTLKADPPGNQNRCFYQCLASHFSLQEEEVFELINNYLLCNQHVDSIENGTVKHQDLLQFFSDADFPSLSECPSTWEECIISLRDQMANHVVIRAAATIFCINCKIIDWRGRMTVEVPFGSQGSGNSDVFFAYTGDHYMLLTDVGCPTELCGQSNITG
ncbi:uncharacterized protein LOC117103850 [Anneissia japonica]|uniref:uncharacterized protein LOC117103850 n=1 Tax=Anneissia japonica TaxID=1529436 RepID=UPI0014259E72|nr:uncharacterized protein LOC117103850 [Anneissia japonica]